MRSNSPYRSSRSSYSIPWKWIIISLFVLWVLFFWKYFWSSIEQDWEFLEIQAGSGWNISVTSLAGKKRTIDTLWKLYTSDSSFVTEGGIAIVARWIYNISVDKLWELGYRSGSWVAMLQLIRWRLWASPEKSVIIRLKNFDISLSKWDTILAEQQSQVYSILYVLSGNPKISSSGNKEYTLPAGKRIMVSQSDLANPATTLESLAWTIDESIRQNAFFLMNKWNEILDSLSSKNNEWAVSTGSWVSLSGTLLSGLKTRTIEFIYPTDNAIITTLGIAITGKILSKDVRKVTINGKEASLSAIDEIFSIKDFPIENEITDLVYKIYGNDGNMIERGVITVYSKNKNANIEKLIPTTFSTGDKKYRITSPTENPYRTTDTNITVSWSVPKDTVEYITVNGYKLKKFVPNTSSWYYYANISYATMNEGFNLYEIRFYGKNNNILSTQVFTIIKELKWSSTLSGEL